MIQRELSDGLWPVMVTPFHDDRSIDWDGVDALVDWYVATGAAGLFAVAQTSEMYALTSGERIALARRVVARAAGRVPVVATGSFGRSFAEIVDSVKAMAETGVDAVIAVTSQIVSQADGDEVLAERLAALANAVGDIPLGLYECPLPYKRLLGVEVIRMVAGTGHYVFLKDTTERPTVIAAKVEAAVGSPLKIFNAEASSLLESLRAGASGFSGNAGSFYPEIVQWLCAEHADSGLEAERVQHLLSVIDAVVSSPHYPGSAKAFLRLARGLDISTTCRVTTASVGEHEIRQLKHLDSLVRSLDLPVKLV